MTPTRLGMNSATLDSMCEGSWKTLAWTMLCMSWRPCFSSRLWASWIDRCSSAASSSYYSQPHSSLSLSLSLSLQHAVREAGTICLRPLQADLWPFDLESGVRVTCDVGYFCANFSLPRPLCSRLRPDVRDRRQTRIIAFNTSALPGRRHNTPLPLPNSNHLYWTLATFSTYSNYISVTTYRLNRGAKHQRPTQPKTDWGQGMTTLAFDVWVFWYNNVASGSSLMY